jgi:Flp pilus assembly protein TadD
MSKEESAPIIADAQRAFNAHQYGEAEDKYTQVLAGDPENVLLRGNLAAAQMEQNKLADAESSLKMALSVDPGDPSSLALFGLLKFRQDKPDEAVAALSDAAKVDPEDARTQLYLGLALNKTGQHIPAETALRKAVRLRPNYGDAHYNLAVYYATSEPPSKEMARWHYQRALAIGHDKVADLEKLLQ